MKKSLCAIGLAVSVLVLLNAHAPGDGTIVKCEQFVPHEYDTMDHQYKCAVSLQLYSHYINKYRTLTDVTFERIEYLSDGLRVVGILARPTTIDRHSYPVIIYNRGGFGEFGKLDVTSLCEQIEFFVRQGYVVLASQYRGNDGSQGIEECGGAEIADIINIIKAAHTLSYTDMTNVFMIGFSRGGMMTYLALKHKVPVKAVAVVAGIADVPAFVARQPDIERSIFTTLMPRITIDSAHKDNEYRQRSAVCWADEFNTPVLLLHNEHDPIVPVEQSRSLAALLEKAEKPHELVILPDNHHQLTAYRDVAQQKIIDWFARYTV